MNIRESLKKNSFIWVDLLITLFILVVLVKYDYYANLAPDSILLIQVSQVANLPILVHKS